MIGVLNMMIRSATRTDDFEAQPPHQHGRVVQHDHRNRRADREALFRARGWGP